MNCDECRREGCNLRIVHLVRLPGTDRFVIRKEKIKVRGVKGDVSPEIGRRQCFSIAVKYGLTEPDMAMVAAQLGEMDKLVDRWHAKENEVLMDLLGLRNGQSLTELAEQASGDAWQKVAQEFEEKFPGYVAKLIKGGQVQVQEA